MQPGSEDIVQMFLLCAVVLALSSHSHSEYVTVELQTAVGIAYDDRRVINAKEHFVAWTMPFVQALIRRKLENSRCRRRSDSSPAGAAVPWTRAPLCSGA